MYLSIYVYTSTKYMAVYSFINMIYLYTYMCRYPCKNSCECMYIHTYSYAYKVLTYVMYKWID